MSFSDFSEAVLLADQRTVVKIRFPESSGILPDTRLLTELSGRVDPESRRCLPVRPPGQSVWRFEPGALVAISEGRMVGAGRARPNPSISRASLDLAFCVDPQLERLGLAPRLAERFLTCIREDLFEFRRPFRWVTTTDPRTAASIPGMRKVREGRHRLALRPWLPWGTRGAQPGNTLVIARALDEPSAALEKADGIALPVVDTADSDPLTVFRPADTASGDRRLVGAELRRQTREQISQITGSIPSPLSEVLGRTKGYPKILEVADQAAAGLVATTLNHAGIAFDEVLVTSPDRAAVSWAIELGLRAVLDWPELHESRSGRRRHRGGARGGSTAESDHGPDLPGAVGYRVATVDEEFGIREALNRPDVHAVRTSHPDLARALRRQLAEAERKA